VVEHVRQVVHDSPISVAPLEETKNNPSAVTRVEGDPFQLMTSAHCEVGPEAVVTPWLVVGATDSRHYAQLTPNVLRFTGAVIGKDDVRRVHGTDERVGVRAYSDAVRIYIQFLKNAAL